MSLENPTTTDNLASVKESSNPVPLFPIQRFCYRSSGSRNYYAYGNTLPEDLLETCSDSEPSILSLGCGDIRSCFYTLWKHFDDTISNAPLRYSKVTFTLVDRSPAVLARNMVFIYLSVHLPENKRPREKWLCGIWAIWYCHELSPEHAKMLSDSFKYLIKYSSSLEAWDCDDNILKSIIKFESTSCLSEISEALKMWYTGAVNVHSVKTMQKSRKNLMSEEKKDSYCKHFALIATGKTKNTECLSVQVSEFRSYFDSGNVFAEPIFERHLPSEKKLNLTLYEKPDGNYTLHSKLVPFRPYQQIFKLTPEALAQASLNNSDILVPLFHFKDKPFLANSFQQFILWIQSVSRVLNKESGKVEFILSTQDALTFCHELQSSLKHAYSAPKASNLFSAIYTSNLMDSLGLPNLVLSCIPLLKNGSLLCTASMIAKSCTPRIEQLLKICFGFDCSLLPVLFGIHCINHEGTEFSSSVMIQPHVRPHIRILYWEKLTSVQHLRFPELPQIQSDNISDALVNLTASCAFACFNPGPYGIASYNTIESAILMLHYFVHNLDKTKIPMFSFWNSFSSTINEVARPFLLSLQTHLLLHEIHIHLVISKEDCPLCNNVSVQDVVRLYSVSVPIKYLQNTIGWTPSFSVIFYENFLPTNAQEIIKASEIGDNVHIFDTFQGISTSEKLELSFYVPLQVLHRNYKVAAFLVRHNQDGSHSMTKMEHLENNVSAKNHRFFQPFLDQSTAQLQPNQDLGEVVFNSCNGYEARTKICISKSTAYEIEKERISPYKIQLFNGPFKFLLSYSYPTGKEVMEICNHTKEKFIEIASRRIQHCFESEKLHYTVTPDHQLSLPPTNDYSIIESYSTKQFTREEFGQKKSTLQEHDLLPLVRVKVVIEKMFKWSQSCSFFTICNQKRSEFILIAVNSVLFDYQLHTPALDLAFCVTENGATIMEWKKLLQSSRHKEDILNEAQLALLKATLLYFAKRTNGNLQTCQSSTVFEKISSRNIARRFSRAVIYFLLFDPDKNIPEEFFWLPPMVAGSYCENCRKFSFTLKRCAKCRCARYCSRACQENHWKMHRQNCKKSNKTPSTLTDHQITGFFSNPAKS